jgi:amino acid transporter
MDAPTHSQKMDNRKETSDLTKDFDFDLDEKHASQTALPSGLISAGSDHLHRRLGGKEIQLFAVGGAIGTCMESPNIFRVGSHLRPFHNCLNAKNANADFLL